MSRIRRLILLFVLLPGVTALLPSEQPDYNVLLAVRPTVDFSAADDDIFGIGGGLALAATATMPFFRPLSVGIDIGYHLLSVNENMVSEAFTCSLLYGAGLIDLRWILFGFLDVGLQFGVGYFYGFVNETNPDSGHGFMGLYGATLGYSFKGQWTVEAVYRSFSAIGVDTMHTVGLGVTWRL